MSLKVYSVQAIAITTRIAHSLGLSDLSATLINSAVGIAHSMNLHKIQDRAATVETDPVGSMQPSRHRWYETVETEIGKRTWWQLVIQDHFSISFTDAYGMRPPMMASASVSG